MNEVPRVKPPKTPLKRVSRNSLRSHALSGSYPPSSEPDHRQPGQSSSQAARSVADPAVHLEHLAPLFADLSDAITDLHINLSNLDLVCQDLDGFNEAFSAFIYGLRMNAYITDFDEAPKLQSFRDAQARKEADRRRLQEQEEKEAKRKLEEQAQTHTVQQQDDQEHSGVTLDQSMIKRSTNQASTSEQSIRGQTNQKANSSSSKPIRQKSSRSFTQASKAQQKQLLKFSEQVMANLPLKFREKQPHQQEMELVISVLKLNPNGLLIKDIVKLEPTLAMHRARECVTALVAAKKAVKFNNEGLVYKLVLD